MRYLFILLVALIGVCLAEDVIEKKVEFETTTRKWNATIEVPYKNDTKCVQTPETDFTTEYFEDIKAEVNSRKEMLLKRLNEYSDQMIQNISKVQLENENKSKDMRDLYNTFETIKLKLQGLIKNSETETSMKLDEFKPRYDSLLKDYRTILFGQEYKLSFNQLEVKEIFGTFNGLSGNNQFKDSKILNSSLAQDLVKLCKFQKNQKWKLIYRASEDGFSASNFHSKCDKYEDTLTIVKATTNNIFGAWTRKAFGGSSGYNQDSDAFIFSLVNKENKSFVATSRNSNSIYRKSSYGPTFGGGHDLYISSNSNVNTESYSYFGHSYKNDVFTGTSTRSKSILAGSYNFKTSDIEVWHKEN